MAGRQPTPERDAASNVSRNEADPSEANDSPYRFGPTAADIARFLEHVRTTGQPETFPTICRTPPSSDSRPVYRTRFSVDRRKRPDGDDAPCAICSPFRPKFVHNGYLVWYPDEGVIRAIGPECGDAFFGGDHYAAARREYDIKQREDDALQFLEDNLPKVLGMMVAISKIERAAEHAGVLHSALRRDGPMMHDRLRAVRKSGGTLKVTVVRERPKPKQRVPARESENEDDERVEGPRGFGRAGSDYDSYDVVVGQLPNSPILNSHFSPKREWNELFELAHSLPRTNGAQEAVYWVADNASSVDHMEKVVDKLRECAALYVRLANRLDRVAQFFSEHVFRSLGEWGRHPDNEFRMEATSDGTTFMLERNELVVRANYQYREKERVVLRPDFEKLHARGDWPSFE